MRVDIADMRQAGVIQRLQQALFDIDRHKAGGWHHQIKAAAACGNLGQSHVIAVIIGDGHGNPGLGLEFFQQFRAGIVAPVIQVQRPLGLCGQCAYPQQGGC